VYSLHHVLGHSCLMELGLRHAQRQELNTPMRKLPALSFSSPGTAMCAITTRNDPNPNLIFQ